MHFKTQTNCFDQTKTLFKEITSVELIKTCTHIFNISIERYSSSNVDLFHTQTNNILITQGEIREDVYVFQFFKNFDSIKKWDLKAAMGTYHIVIHTPGSQPITHARQSMYLCSIKKIYLKQLLIKLDLESLLYKIHEKKSIELSKTAYEKFLYTFETFFYLSSHVSQIDSIGLMEYKADVELPTMIIHSMLYGTLHDKKHCSEIHELTLSMALDLIQSKPFALLNIQELAKQINTSERTLRYIFSDHLGISPAAFLKAYRLNHIYSHVLSESTSIKEIAHRHHISHLGQFSHDFKKHFSLLPSQIRKNGPLND